MADIIEGFGKRVDALALTDSAASRQLLLAGFRAMGIKLRVFPDKRLPPARRYIAGEVNRIVCRMLSHPEQAALTSVFMPCELLHAMDITPMCAELYSSFVSGSDAEAVFAEAAESEGVPETYCSYHKVLPGCAYTGMLPPPRIIVNASLVCDANNLTFYGRETVGMTGTSVTEITCHARGAHYLYPAARTVIDIGGQDSKVIRIDEEGHVMGFAMNDKCAAGTGRFLELMARTLEMSLDEMSERGLTWRNNVAISSMCTVFAESEVVSLVAENTAPSDIVHGLNMAVAAKTAALVKRAGGGPPHIMTGGVARNRGVVKALEERLGRTVFVPEEAQLCCALGAALIALNK